jgi:alkanesulfonate monooxygenase SsuD/methylene tetrahydromethanopterin reductase-like flavin-dependent oxidoreductase (luciferase family)
MRIGFVLPQGNDISPSDGDAGSRIAQTGREIIEVARLAEQSGVDSLWIFDHLLMHDPADAEPTATWESWSLLSALATATGRAEIGTIVTCTGFRHPALLAKMAHTVHELSAGRLVLGLGAGWHEPEYTAFGYPFDHRFSRFAESLTIITDMFNTGRSTLDGRFHTTVNAPLLPPATLTPPPILIGTRRPRMLELTARHAQAYNTAWHGLPGPRFREDRDALAAACAVEDRDPKSVRLTVGIEPAGFGIAIEEESLADALHAWAAEDIDDLILMVDPASHANIDIVLAAIRRWRGLS